MLTCLFPGSFDPPTLGHVDIIRRASALFDHVYVAVMYNADKRAMFTPQERVSFMEKCVATLPNVSVTMGQGLTLDLAASLGANVLLRAMRSEGDAPLEVQLAAANRHVGGIDTLCMFTDPALSFVSSTIVRDVIRHGGRLTGLVPPEIENLLQSK